jgi:hypothetical protein
MEYCRSLAKVSDKPNTLKVLAFNRPRYRIRQMRKTVLTFDYKCRQLITDGGVMGEFFCRGICGNPCGSNSRVSSVKSRNLEFRECASQPKAHKKNTIQYERGVSDGK